MKRCLYGHFKPTKCVSIKYSFTTPIVSKMKGKESGKGSPSNRSDDEKSSHTASAGMETITPFTGNKKWDTMYHHLVTYKRNHNNCLVPNRYKQMPQLGNWVSTQRRYYKLKQAGNDTPLCQLRIDLLTKIGFVWATKDPRHVSIQ